MNIRPATEEDIPTCERLAHEPGFAFADGRYPDRNFFINFLEDPYFLVLEIENSVVGYIVSEPLKGGGVGLWYLVVDKAMRGKGYGSILMKEFEKRCKEIGRKWILLEAVADNPDALAFYKKLGFHKGETQIEHLKYL